jgi:hypothetical protein
MEFFTVRVDPTAMGHLHNFFATEDWETMSRTMDLIMYMGPHDEVYGEMWIKI